MLRCAPLGLQVSVTPLKQLDAPHATAALEFGAAPLQLTGPGQQQPSAARPQPSSDATSTCADTASANAAEELRAPRAAATAATAAAAGEGQLQDGGLLAGLALLPGSDVTSSSSGVASDVAAAELQAPSADAAAGDSQLQDDGLLAGLPPWGSTGADTAAATTAAADAAAAAAHAAAGDVLLQHDGLLAGLALWGSAGAAVLDDEQGLSGDADQLLATLRANLEVGEEARRAVLFFCRTRA